MEPLLFSIVSKLKTFDPHNGCSHDAAADLFFTFPLLLLKSLCSVLQQQQGGTSWLWSRRSSRTLISTLHLWISPLCTLVCRAAAMATTRPSLGCLELKRQAHTHTHTWAERRTNRGKSNKRSIKMPARLLKYSSELVKEWKEAFLCSSVTPGRCSSHCDGQRSVRGMFHMSERKTPPGQHENCDRKMF